MLGGESGDVARDGGGQCWVEVRVECFGDEGCRVFRMGAEFTFEVLACHGVLLT